MTFNMQKCSANTWMWYDTSDFKPSMYGCDVRCRGNGTFLDRYLCHVSNGTVLLGITMDDPSTRLGPALSSLLDAGIDVSDLSPQAMFAFVMQKGFRNKTLSTKSTPHQDTALTFNVTIIETSKRYVYFCNIIVTLGML